MEWRAEENDVGEIGKGSSVRFKQGRGLRVGCAGDWREGINWVKSVRVLLHSHMQDGEHHKATGRKGQVRDRRRSKRLASHSAPRTGCYSMSQGAQGKRAGTMEQGKFRPPRNPLFCY